MAKDDFSSREVIELLVGILSDIKRGTPSPSLIHELSERTMQQMSDSASSSRKSRAATMGRSTSVAVLKPKRKVSRYQRVFGKHLKALKKKHPRSSISVLMKKAHRLTKREMKK